MSHLAKQQLQLYFICNLYFVFHLQEEPLSRNIRRIFAPVRNIPPPRSRRAAQQLAASISNSNSMNSSGIATFSSARESIDPIAELLSQLSGVRRAAQQQSAATTASQLQLLQQQLQFERQQVSLQNFIRVLFISCLICVSHASELMSGSR